MPRLVAVLALCAAVAASGCDMLGGVLGIESAEKTAASREAEGKAIGAACRHAARAIEDCYTLNRKADKAAVFAGWRDMNDYMRENKIDPVAPLLAAQPPVARVKTVARAAETDGRDAAPAPTVDAAITKGAAAAAKPAPRAAARAHES